MSRLAAVLAAIPAAIGLWLVCASLWLLFIAENDGMWLARGYHRLYAWWTFFPGHGLLEHGMIGLSAVAGALPIALLAQGGWRLHERAKPALHGKSEFASNEEAEAGGIVFSPRPRPDAILLGRQKRLLASRYVCLPGTDHAALYARTGAGKGVSFVVPNCLTWGGSLVAFDIKGELYRLTGGQRAAMGQNVFYWSPAAPDGHSHRYNPFSCVPRGQDGCIDAIHRVMHIHFPPTKDADKSFWVNSARALASGGAVMLAETPGEALTLPAVLRMFTRPDADRYLRRLVDDANHRGRPFPTVAVDAVMGWVNNSDPRTKEGLLAELRSHLSIYASPTIAAAVAESDFDLREIRKRGMSIYVGIGPADLRRLRPLLALFFQQLLDLNTQVEFDQDPAHTHRVLMMMDEVWAPGRMDMIADASAFVRSYGIRMAYVVQTKAQLVSIYGQEGSENLFQNTGAEVVFGASDMRLCKEISERAGFDTVTETSHSRPRFGAFLQPAKQNENEAVRRRALLMPQEVARLPKWQQLIFRPGMQALLTERVEYYSDPTFQPLLREPPPVPELIVRVARGAQATP